MIERLEQFIKSQKISTRSFEQKISASDGMIRRAINNKTDIQSKWLHLIAENYPQLSMDWLITGRGTMLRSSKSNSKEDANIQSRHLIPLYDISAIGGKQYGAEMNAVTSPSEMIDTGDWFLDATAAIRVQGDSMSPEYKPGSVVALKEVRDWRIIMYGEDYVVETDEIRVIKRLQHSEHADSLLACSVNTEEWESGPLKGRLIHEPFEIPLDAVRRIFLVLGEVRRNHSCNIINVGV